MPSTPGPVLVAFSHKTSIASFRFETSSDKAASSAAAVFYLILLPVAGLLEGVPVVTSASVLSVWSSAVIAAAVVALFDWVVSLIELPLRPIAAAVVGWVLAFALLRKVLALPDLPGWFVAIGMLGAIPGFVCSWVTIKVDAMPVGKIGAA